jgi:hypothetical protein
MQMEREMPIADQKQVLASPSRAMIQPVSGFMTSKPAAWQITAAPVQSRRGAVCFDIRNVRHPTAKQNAVRSKNQANGQRLPVLEERQQVPARTGCGVVVLLRSWLNSWHKNSRYTPAIFVLYYPLLVLNCFFGQIHP